MILTRFLIRAGGLVFIGVALSLSVALILSATLFPSESQIAYMRTWEYASDIYLLDVRTGLSIPLTASSLDNERYPEWSLDGEEVAFHANYNSPDYDLYIMRLEDRSLRMLPLSNDMSSYDEAMMAYSPDGAQIAFHAGGYAQGFNLYLTDLVGEDLIALTYGSNEFVHATWSPDGQQMAFTLYLDDGVSPIREQIYVMDVQQAARMGGSVVDQMMLITEQGYFPAWSPDGQYLLYVSDVRGSGLEDIYRYDFETGLSRNLTIDLPYSSETHPDWTPDGHIVFASDHAAPSGGYDLYMMSADGGHLRRLTHLPGDELAPDWRP